MISSSFYHYFISRLLLISKIKCTSRRIEHTAVNNVQKLMYAIAQRLPRLDLIHFRYSLVWFSIKDWCQSSFWGISDNNQHLRNWKWIFVVLHTFRISCSCTINEKGCFSSLKYSFEPVVLFDSNVSSTVYKPIYPIIFLSYRARISNVGVSRNVHANVNSVAD